MRRGILRGRREPAPRQLVEAVRPAELAWIAAVPCALVTAVVVAVLGPPLGRALLSPRGEALWPKEAIFVFGGAEPVKHARYLLALLGPALLAFVVLAAVRRRPAMPRARARALVTASQLLLLAGIAAALLGQYGFVLPGERPPWRIFGAAAIAVAIGLPLLLLAALRRPAVAGRLGGWVSDTRARRVAALLAAAAYAAAWLLAAVDSDRTIAFAQTSNLIPWGMDDPFAILDGRTPLVDFHAMYAQLWPYLIAGSLHLFGANITVYTLVLTAVGVATLLALYAILRRVARSATLGLALYVPVVATGFLTVPDLQGIGLSNVRIFSVWPLRYAGPYLIAWLTVRQVDGVAPRRLWPLFLVAGLVAIDNLEFGIAALAATLVALACTRPPRTWRAAGPLAAEAAAGLLGAVLLVSLLTLARSGELPRVGLLIEFPRLFGVLGLAALPMPALGFQLVLYVTFAGAIAAAVVRFARRDANLPLTAMLAWSGVFGLFAASYYVGRSDRLKLAALFSAWAFALALLAVVVAGALAVRGWRRPAPAELAVLMGCGLALSAVVQTPTPWSQVERLERISPSSLWRQPAQVRFVAAHTAPHEHIAALMPLGHRIAYDLGLVGVAPYSFIEAMVTQRQMRTLLDAVRREHAHKLFLPDALLPDAHRVAFADAGFVELAHGAGLSEWVDGPAG